ncbi:MAG: PRC-barrel domain-containing protein [Clostridiaceae bacterium]
MYRKKDFLFMDVFDIKGKNIGCIKDLLIDFNKGEVIGFSIISYKIFQSSQYVLKEDIISFNKYMVVSKCRKGSLTQLSHIRLMDVIDLNGNIIGTLEDLILEGKNFIINGVVLWTGYLTSLIYGKKVLLVKDMLLGDDSILYFGNKDTLSFSNIPNTLLFKNIKQ